MDSISDSQEIPKALSFRLRSDCIWMALFLLLALAFLIPTFFGYVFCRSDLKLLFYPWHEFVRNALSNGEMPLWDPTIMCGVPFLASNLPAGFFYPLRFILYPFEYHRALNLYMFLHLSIAGISMFYFLKSYRLRASSCFFGGVSFMCAPYLVGRIPYLAEFTLLCLAPLALLLTKYVCEIKSARAVALGSVLYACMHFVGQPQMLYPFTIIMGFFWLDFLVRDIKSGASLKHTCIFAFPSMIVLGTLMGSILLIPFVEFVMHSDRARGLSYSEFAGRSFPLYELFGILVPNPFGASSVEWLHPNWERLQRCLTPYIGVIPLVMVFYSGKLKRLKYLFPVLLLLLWAIGGNWGWFELFYEYVPGVRFMRIPERTLLLACLLLTIYSAFGFERFTGDLGSRKLRIRALIIPIGCLIILLVCSGFLLLWSTKLPAFLINTLRSSSYSLIIEHTTPSIAQTVLFLSLFSLLFALAVRGRISQKGATFSLIILTVINLFPTSLETQFITGKEYLYSVRNIWISRLSFIRQDASPQMRICLPFKKVNGIGFQLEPELLPNVGQIHSGILNTSGYNCIILEKYDMIEKAIEKSPSSRVRLLSLMGVKYYFAEADEEPPADWPPEHGPEYRIGSSVVIYRNPAYVPRIHCVGDFIVNDSEEETLRLLSSPDFDPLKTIVLEEDMTGVSVKEGNGSKADITVIDSGLNQIMVDVSADSECFLVLSDTYYPGWKAEIDGKEAEIYRGNLLFRAIRVPKGASRVVFKYEPCSFYIGMIISLLATLMCFTLLCFIKSTPAKRHNLMA